MIPIGIMSQHVAVVGRTGSGKTYAARGLVERLLAEGRRVVVLDPTGAWWGLRLNAEGTSSSPFNVAIVGGEHGDVPLSVEHAERLAGWLAAKDRRSAVIDLSEMLIGERHRFVTEFAQELYRRNRMPLHLVVDEADEFMPQNPMPEVKRLFHHMDRIVRRGRIRGFRVTMITQRPAVLHKNCLTQANTLIAMRLMAPQDRKAIEAWIEGQGDADAGGRVLRSLAGLKTGEGWLWAPELDLLQRQAFPRCQTYDSGRSPEESDEAVEPELVPGDFDDLRALLAVPDDDAEPLGPGVIAGPTPERVKALCREQFERGYEAGVIHGDRLGRERLAERIGKAIEIAITAVGDISAEVLPAAAADWEQNGESLSLPPVTAPAAAKAIGLANLRAAAGNGHGPAATPRINAGDGKRRILTALAQFPAGLSQQRLAMLAQITRSGGTWRTYVGALRGAGLIEGSEPIRITTAGLKALGSFDPLPTGEGLRRYWANWLGGGGERRIFEVLLGCYPKAMSQHQVAGKAGIALGGGTWRTYVGRLRGLKLITGRSELRAAEELFQ